VPVALDRLSRAALAGGGTNVGKMLAVEMMFSFYFGVYSGTMLGALVEVVPKHVRTTCFSLAFALAAGLFGTFTPYASTWPDRSHRRQGLAGLLADVCRCAGHLRRAYDLSRRQGRGHPGGRRRLTPQSCPGSGPACLDAGLDFHANKITTRHGRFNP